MARIPNIKVVIPEGDATMAVVTDADTGEKIKNIISLKIDLDANREPFAMVEMKVFTGFEYESPADVEEEIIRVERLK